MRIVACVLSLIAIISCGKNYNAVAKNNIAVAVTDSNAQKGVSILALGDSYTIGQSVKQEDSFPYQLKESLIKQDISVSDLKIIAQTGWTTSDLKAAIAGEAITKKYDVVTLLIGVNNQFRGYESNSYRKEFVELLNTAIGFAGGNKAKVFVLSIPDWGVTPFGGAGKDPAISKDIDKFNLINKEETLNARVSYTDITGISREALTNTSLLAPDMLHPSGIMYSRWNDRLIPSVLKSLGH